MEPNPLEIKMVENRWSRKIFSYGGPCGLCFQLGLTSVNLGVLGMKKFVNHCRRLSFIHASIGLFNRRPASIFMFRVLL